MNPQAMDFVRAFFQQQEPVAAICHGPWSSVETGLVSARSSPTAGGLTSEELAGAWQRLTTTWPYHCWRSRP